MKIRFFENNNSVEWFLFFLSPLVSLPFLIWGVMKGKHSNLVIISLVMAMIGFIFPAFADSYKHTQQYLIWVDHGKDGILINKGQIDFVFYSLSNIFAKNHIAFEYIKAMFVFIAYQASFFLYKKIIFMKGLEWDSYDSMLLFWIFFLSVPFIWVVTGLRMATACYIAMVGWFYFYYRSYGLGTIFYIVALSVHFGSLMFIPIFLAQFLPNIKMSSKSFTIISLAILCAGGVLLSILPSSLVASVNMEKNVDVYMSQSQKLFGDSQSINGLIAEWLERIMLVYVFCRIAFAKMIIDSKDMLVIAVCFFSWFITHPFIILFQKISLFIIPIILFLYIKNVGDVRILKHIALCCLVSFFAYSYGYRRPISTIPFYKLMVSPLYVFWNVDTKTALREVVYPA